MRGHSMKTGKSQCLKDIKNYCLAHRTVGVWNGLSEEVVAADSSDIFKEKLDKFQKMETGYYELCLPPTHTHAHLYTYICLSIY